MTLALLATLWATAPASAQDWGIPVTVVVMQVDGTPVADAVVHDPMGEAHAVNLYTGEYTESVFYSFAGEEVVIREGFLLTFRISAPGYLTETVQYIVRKRRNRIPVVLARMQPDPEPDPKARVVRLGLQPPDDEDDAE